MNGDIPNTLHVCPHTYGAHTLFLAIFSTRHCLAFWPSRWPIASNQTELQVSSFLIAGFQKEPFVAAVPLIQLKHSIA